MSETGRIFVVTGASSGIGLATAEGLAREGRGRRLVLVCRDEGRGRAAVDRVRRAGAAEGDVDLVLADLSSQRTVRRLARELAERCPRIDVLIHNAGVITPERRLTDDGIETQLAVNHLAPFLLTQLLRAPLIASGTARVVVVASQVERHGTIRFDDLQGEQSYDSLEAYYQSKLANVLFTYALAERWAATTITVNCLHPGVVRSNLLDAFKAAGRRRREGAGGAGAAPAVGQAVRAGLRLGRLGLRALRAGVERFAPRAPDPDDDGPLTPADGAKTPIRVATAPELAGVTGRYFREEGEARSSPQSYDVAARERLWSVSAALVGIDPA
ncbi:MAG TPA: SDR family oxidoreductase [Polyangia bacterium]|nr:SDR family oxidoreductase [Polyangia bacterium]